MGLETGGTLIVDLAATGSFYFRVRGESDPDSDLDPDPSSESDGVDSARSSFESSSLMGGVVGIVFHRLGGLGVVWGGVSQLGCWDGRTGCYCGGGGGHADFRS